MRGLALAAVAALLGACSGGATTARDDWETVFRATPTSSIAFAAAEDGTLFVAAGDGLFRRLPGDGCQGAPGAGGTGSEAGCWQRMADAPEPILEMYAPSRDEVFALPRTNVVYRWRSGAPGMEPLHTPLTDSVLVDGHHRRRIFVLALAGRGPSDVYAVGEEGSIQHWDGRAWTLEPNPLVPAPGAPPSYDDDFFAVGVAGGEVYAGAGELLVRGPTGWSRIPRPDTAWARGGISAIAQSGGRLVVGGGFLSSSYLAVREGGAWRDLTPHIRGFRDRVSGGRGNPDGSAVVWARTGELARVSAGSVRVTRVPLHTLKDAVVVGDHVYAAGILGSEHVVLRSGPP